LVLPVRDDLRMRAWHRDATASLFALIDRNAAHLREWLTGVDTDHTEACKLAFIYRCVVDTKVANPSN
jgi:hypothetical protein